MKRTKRYGGFLVGDRVQDRNGMQGTIVGMRRGRLTVQFDGVNHNGTAMPNQLINLTRFEDDEEYKAKIANFILDKINAMVNATTERLHALYSTRRERVITFSPSDLPDTPLELL